MMTGLAGVAMWLMMGLMLTGAATAAIAWTRRHLPRQSHSQPPATEQTPEEIRRRRYAAGEIGPDEYRRRRRDVTQH
jgi:uncharacterized membrane protein